ncbi:MAG: hypothetical protein ACHQF2_09835 [Flavobacteriales bacterium]
MRVLFTFILLMHSLHSFSTHTAIGLVDADKLKSQHKKKRVKDSLAWVSQDDKLILGSEISQLRVNLDFDKVFYYIDDSSIHYTRSWDYWKFRTSHDPSAISYSLNSRFGKFNFFSHKIPGTELNNNFNTRFVNYGYAYQYKSVIIGASYRKIQGFRRENHDFVWIDTLRDLAHTDIRVSGEIITQETSEFNKYGFSQLYIPVKGTYYINFKSEFAYTGFADKIAVIPYYAIFGNSTQGYTSKLDPNQDMQKYRLYMQSFMVHFGGVIPLLKKTGEKAKSLSLRLDGQVGLLDIYYFTHTSVLNQIAKSGLKFGYAKSSVGSVNLCYSGKWLIVGTALVWKLTYLTPAISTANKPTFIYFLRTLTGYVGFRIPFKRAYTKMSSTREKWFGKSKK